LESELLMVHPHQGNIMSAGDGGLLVLNSLGPRRAVFYSVIGLIQMG
jgi:hypothetical protein